MTLAIESTVIIIKKEKVINISLFLFEFLLLPLSYKN